MTRFTLIVVGALFTAGAMRADETDDRLARELAGLVRDPRLPLRERVEAARTLVKLGPRAAIVVPDLMAQLARLRGVEHETLQETIVEALGRMGAPARRALPTLARTSGRSVDIDQAIKRSTTQILAASDAEDVEALVRQLRSPDGSLRLRAAKALGGLGPVARGAVASLTTVLDDADGDVRRAALTALRLVQPDAKPTPEVIRAISKDLADPDPTVRYAAVRALGRLGPAAASALTALQPLLSDPDNDVRRAAADAAAKISG